MFARFFALAVLAFPAAALAQPLTLEWKAPADCADREAVQRLVSQRLGEHAATETLEASGEVVSTPAGYALTLKTPTGERHLEAPSCDELAQSAAVILALLIDPHSAPQPISEPESESERGPKPEPQPEQTLPEPTPRAPPLLTGFIRAELAGDLGLFPRVGLGPGIAGGVRLHRTTIELAGSYLPTQDLVTRDGRDVGDVRAWSGRLGACHALLAKPELGPCAFLEYARLAGRGNFDPNDPVPINGGLFSLLFAARLGVPFGPFAYVLELGIDLPLSIAEFKVQQTVPVYETGTVVGRLRTGFELRF